MIRSGSHQLAASISRFANRNGASLERAAEVTKILTDGTKAVGVRLASGEEILAKKIVTTTDPEMTFLDLVGEDVCNAGVADPRRSDEGLGVGVDAASSTSTTRSPSGPTSRTRQPNSIPTPDRALIKIMGVETLDDVLEPHQATAKEGRFGFVGRRDHR